MNNYLSKVKSFYKRKHKCMNSETGQYSYLIFVKYKNRMKLDDNIAEAYNKEDADFLLKCINESLTNFQNK